jgi:predicted nucleotidyltransferase
MDLRTPITSIIPGVRGVVLGIVASTDGSLTGSGIARLAGGRVSQSGVSKALGQLVGSGIVRCQSAGPANLYTLNRDHVAAPAVVLMSRLREELIDRVAAKVETWGVAPVAVWLFGSAARATGGDDSDIDLFLLRPDVVAGGDSEWLMQTLELANSVHDWSGNNCDLLEYGETEFTELVAQSDPLVATLRSEALALWGDSPRERTSGRRR